MPWVILLQYYTISYSNLLNLLTNFNFSDYIKEQNKQNIRKKRKS